MIANPLEEATAHGTVRTYSFQPSFFCLRSHESHPILQAHTTFDKPFHANNTQPALARADSLDDPVFSLLLSIPRIFRSCRGNLSSCSHPRRKPPMLPTPTSLPNAPRPRSSRLTAHRPRDAYRPPVVSISPQPAPFLSQRRLPADPSAAWRNILDLQPCHTYSTGLVFGRYVITS